jgi:hypothetical protein
MKTAEKRAKFRKVESPAKQAFIGIPGRNAKSCKATQTAFFQLEDRCSIQLSSGRNEEAAACSNRCGPL